MALSINLIIEQKGSGLEKDAIILKKALEELGHTVFWPNKKESPKPNVDINIFVERLQKAYFKLAKKNYFIPNPEFYPKKKDLEQVDLILCRTHNMEKIFQKPLHTSFFWNISINFLRRIFGPSFFESIESSSTYEDQLFYLGFTGIDQSEKPVIKDYYAPLHAIGKSPWKGTLSVLSTWQRNPNFPKLTFMRSKNSTLTLKIQKFKGVKNIEFVTEYFSNAAYKEIQNRFGMHICTSEIEGFGHYISEAMSTGAVVVTTDAPPMNEFIQDPRCKIKIKSSKRKGIGTSYTIDLKDLKEKLTTLFNLPPHELEAIGTKNRQLFLEKREEFQQQLKKIF
ncbi:MAG: glycosyltransferase [Verrucomicrobia bacterium]|nr:glycosyltransferase [Verrucomicrobiota bacterium]